MVTKRCYWRLKEVLEWCRDHLLLWMISQAFLQYVATRFEVTGQPYQNTAATFIKMITCHNFHRWNYPSTGFPRLSPFSRLSHFHSHLSYPLHPVLLGVWLKTLAGCGGSHPFERDVGGSCTVSMVYGQILCYCWWTWFLWNLMRNEIILHINWFAGFLPSTVS